MISYLFHCTSRSSESITINDHTDRLNVFALQSFPKFVRNVKSTEIERQGQNNYWDFFSYNGRMTIIFSGIIVAENHQKLEQMRAQLLRVFALPLQSTPENDGYVTISWTDDDGIEKEVEAKIIQDIIFDRRLARRSICDFQIQLKAKRNYISSRGGYTGTAEGARGYITAGFKLPTAAPITSAITYHNAVTVNPSLIEETVPSAEHAQAFTNATIVTVNHKLYRTPTVRIETSAGDILYGIITHTSFTQFTVEFSKPFSGTVYYS